MVIHIHCRMCNKTFPIEVDIAGFNRWRAGELIQRALPNLTVDERELLISNTCGECFDKLFRA